MAALGGAVALVQVQHVAVLVGEDLHLDVPAALDVALQQQGIVAERGGGLTACGGDRRTDLVLLAHDAHALAATTCGGLDEDREGKIALGGEPPISDLAQRPQHGDACLVGDLARRVLAAQGVHRVGRWADPGESRAEDGPREVRLLRQEPVAGVHGVGRTLLGGSEQGGDRQVGLGGRGRADPYRHVGGTDVGGGAVGVRVDGDGAQSEAARGADDPQGDLAAVGDQEGSDHWVLTSGRCRRTARRSGRWRQRRGRGPAPGGCRRGRSRRRPRGGRWRSRGCPGPRTGHGSGP